MSSRSDAWSSRFIPALLTTVPARAAQTAVSPAPPGGNLAARPVVNVSAPIRRPLRWYGRWVIPRKDPHGLRPLPRDPVIGLLGGDEPVEAHRVVSVARKAAAFSDLTLLAQDLVLAPKPRQLGALVAGQARGLPGRPSPASPAAHRSLGEIEFAADLVDRLARGKGSAPYTGWVQPFRTLDSRDPERPARSESCPCPPAPREPPTARPRGSSSRPHDPAPDLDVAPVEQDLSRASPLAPRLRMCNKRDTTTPDPGCRRTKERARASP